MRIDLNSDCGESFGEDQIGDDEAIIPLLSSANLACGEHGGDHRVMQRAVLLCVEHNVRIGAHVSYPDRANFGREVMDLTPKQLRYTVVEQLRRLSDVAKKSGAEIRYVKPHGALYNQAQQSAETAETILSAMRAFEDSLAIMCMPNSVVGRLAQQLGMRVITEGFADRAYEVGGTLASRKLPGAVHQDVATVVAQALAISRSEPVRTIDGSQLLVAAESICIHSDTPGALQMLTAVRTALTEAGIEIGC